MKIKFPPFRLNDRGRRTKQNLVEFQPRILEHSLEVLGRGITVGRPTADWSQSASRESWKVTTLQKERKRVKETKTERERERDIWVNWEIEKTEWRLGKVFPGSLGKFVIENRAVLGERARVSKWSWGTAHVNVCSAFRLRRNRKVSTSKVRDQAETVLSRRLLSIFLVKNR